LDEEEFAKIDALSVEGKLNFLAVTTLEALKSIFADAKLDDRTATFTQSKLARWSG